MVAVGLLWLLARAAAVSLETERVAAHARLETGVATPAPRTATFFRLGEKVGRVRQKDDLRLFNRFGIGMVGDGIVRKI